MIHTPAPNRTPLAAIVVFVACSLAFVGARLTLHAQEQLDFIASFTDANGSPVTDVVADELTMLEGGVKGTWCTCSPSSEPWM